MTPQTIITITSVILAIISVGGAIVANINGIRNSIDYREAKEAAVKLKDAEIAIKQADIDSIK